MTFLAATVDADALTGAASMRGPIPDEAVTAAAKLVDASGVSPCIASWRDTDRADTGAGGRPAAIDDRATLVVLLLLAAEHSPLFVDRGADLIARRLSPQARALLGIRQHPADGEDWYDRCWRAVHRLLDVIDPYPAPRKRLLSHDEQHAVIAERDPATQAEKQRRLDWVCNRLIDASWKLLPRDVRRRWRGNVAIDATPVAAHAKPYTKRSPETVELDAGWYVREGDHHDPGDEVGHGIRKLLFGWEAHLAVATPNDPAKAPDFPLLAAGIAFDKPGFNVAENALTIFTSMHEREYPVGVAVADRAYWPGSQPDKLQLPLRALGWSNVNDYRDDQLGIKDGHGGGIQVEGDWYCPSMPTPLVEATIDYRVHKTIDEATWQQRIAARAKYRLRPKERADTDGHQPLVCPAAGPSATVACPLRADSLTGERVHLRARVTTPPDHPDRICTQTSVSFPPTAGAKYRQDMQYGTPEWQDLYSTARNTIEGFNGYVKDGGFEALADPTRRRLRGRTAHHLLTTLLVVSANIRKIRTFLAERSAPNGRITPLTARRTRRRRESLTAYLPDANAPPIAPTGTEQ